MLRRFRRLARETRNLRRDGIVAGSSPSSILQWEMFEPGRRVAAGDCLRARSRVEVANIRFQSHRFPGAGKNAGIFLRKYGRTRVFAGFHENTQGLSREIREFSRKLRVICCLQPHAPPFNKRAGNWQGKLVQIGEGQKNVSRKTMAVSEEVGRKPVIIFSPHGSHTDAFARRSRP